jgi:NTP pyrophosphatase (non-canonical NTP hydrolase)
MSNTQHPTNDDTDIAHELQEIGEEFGCQRLKGEKTDAYALRLLAYVCEMAEEMRAVEARVRDLATAPDRSQ